MGCLWCQYSHYTQAAAYKTHLPLCQGALGFLLEKTCSHMISLVHCTVGKDVVGWYCKETCTGSSSPSSTVVQHELVSKLWIACEFGHEAGSHHWRMEYICRTSGPSYSYSAISVIWCELWTSTAVTCNSAVILFMGNFPFIDMGNADCIGLGFLCP